MALLKSQTLYNGQIVTYHRIGKYTFMSPSVVVAMIESYRDRAHREFSFIPVISRDVDFPFDGDATTLAAQAYAYIKTVAEWEGAEDA